VGTAAITILSRAKCEKDVDRDRDEDESEEERKKIDSQAGRISDCYLD